MLEYVSMGMPDRIRRMGESLSRWRNPKAATEADKIRQLEQEKQAAITRANERLAAWGGLPITAHTRNFSGKNAGTSFLALGRVGRDEGRGPTYDPSISVTAPGHEYELGQIITVLPEGSVVTKITNDPLQKPNS
jgi:hypothetical protein